MWVNIKYWGFYHWFWRLPYNYRHPIKTYEWRDRKKNYLSVFITRFLDDLCFWFKNYQQLFPKDNPGYIKLRQELWRKRRFINP